MEEMSNEEVVIAARNGDQRAWRELVRRYHGLVWAVARSFGLSKHDTEDVSQTTWLQLAIHIRALKDPAAVGGWLATTSRRESLRAVRRRSRELPTDFDDPSIDQADYHAEQGEDKVVRAELRSRITSSFARLPEFCRTLLTLLLQEPPLSYDEIGKILGMRRGSIGPNRARCLGKLRKIAGL
jgi:RNA polymerase sigma factor (sigma-70 family)